MIPYFLARSALQSGEKPSEGKGYVRWFRARKTSISALLTMPKPLTVWNTINCGKFWKRWEYQTTLTYLLRNLYAGQEVWYSHLLQNFPQFIVFHTVKGFGIVNKAEIDIFLKLLAFLMIQRMLAVWSLVPLPFLKPAWTAESVRFMYCWSLAWRILSITLLACEMSAIAW